jgi:hypothetical protein
VNGTRFPAAGKSWNVLHGNGTVLTTSAFHTGSAMHVSVEGRGTGNVTVLLAADENATSCISATLVFGAEGSLSMSQTGGDGDSESVDLTTEEDVWYTFTACYNGTTARAAADATCMSATLTGITGDRADLKASTASDFDDFFTAEVSEGCA